MNLVPDRNGLLMIGDKAPDPRVLTPEERRKLMSEGPYWSDISWARLVADAEARGVSVRSVRVNWPPAEVYTAAHHIDWY